MDREKLRIYYNFNAKRSKDPIARGGWRNSYDGSLFTPEEMKEFTENVYLKLEPYLRKESTTVLEIGCASGLTMYRIAPYVKKYIGTDMAGTNQKISEEYNREHGIGNIDLYTCYAHEIKKLWEDRYPGERADILIMNSVVQYFETEAYFLDVIEEAAGILGDDGLMFLGDIRDKDKREEFEMSVVQHQMCGGGGQNPSGSAMPQKGYEDELFLSPSFFEELPRRFPFIDRVEITDKIGSIENELKRYRFDVVLHVTRRSML